MSGISISHSRPRRCSGEKTLRRCRNNVEADNVILIDVDTENFDNVVIIDVPESLPKKTQRPSAHRKDKKWSFRNVIHIDDDENHDINHSFGINNASFSAGTSSNRGSCRVAKNSPDAAFEESQCGQDTATPVRLSKCKRTYSGNASTRNRFGLNADTESDSSDNDYPDCELVEDSSGKVQEWWEKAFSRRKKDFRNGRSDIRDHNSASRGVDVDSTAFGFSTGKSNNEKDDLVFGCSNAFDDVAVDHDPECEPGSSSHHVEENRKHPPKFKSCVDEDSCCGKSSPLEDEATIYMNKNSLETEVDCSRYFPGDNHKNSPETATDSSSAPLSDENGSVSRKSSFSKGFSGTVLRNTHLNEAKLREDISISMSNVQQEEDKDGQVHSHIGETSPCLETCIINEREKLKETDEYKRAMEEEWASRQQALQIQAEEAKHLRRLQKRRKAESIRLLDMERRQKQRIEEVRNIQRKDEENINLKERVRAEVRNELKKLEVSCHTMASLLQLLGIRVGGWPNPLPKEVQTAYKRALLAFHPDRASQSDIRQQVEAEEKFKLINRLKEKFSPSL